MFGLTEFMGLFHETIHQAAHQTMDEPTRLAIIPTFILPFTILGMILTSLATWIAAFFGIQLKAEGPKRLFEVLMRPKVLIWTLISNVAFYGAYVGGKYFLNSARPAWLIEFRNTTQPAPLSNYANFKTDLISLDEQLLKAQPRPIKNIEVAWQTDVKHDVFGGIIPSEGALFLGTSGGHLMELDAKTGTKTRDIWIGQPVMTAPLIIDQNLYVGEGVHETHHARYYKFDLATAKMSSYFATKGHIERTATLGEIGTDHLLLIPAGSDGLYAVDAKTMKKVWQAPVGHVDSFATADKERVYVGTGLEMGFDETGTKAFALDLKTGQIIWQKNLPTSAWGMPIFWKDLVCFSVGDVYKNTQYGQISCYNKTTGEEDLAINLSGAVIAQPILIGDRLFVSDLHGKIYQLNLTEKKIDWSLQVPSKRLNYAPLAIDSEGHLVMPGRDGLYVYSIKTHEQLYHWPGGEKWRTPYANILLYKDLWIIADGKGIVTALRPIY